MNMKKYILAFIVLVVLIIALGKMFGEKHEPYVRSEKIPKTVVARPAVGVQPVKDKNNWRYKESEDKMTSKKVYSAVVTANELLNFDFPYNGGSTATLTLRYKDGETNVMLQVDKGQFISNVNGNNVRVRFGSSKAKRYSTSMSSDYAHDLIFIGNETDFVRNVKKNERVIIETEFYNEGVRQIEFDIRNLKWNH